MGSKSKSKGYRTEYNLVKRFQAAGLDAKRQVLSGALPDHPHDIKINNPDFIIEVKAISPKWAEGKTPCAEIGEHLFYNDIE